MKKIFAVVFLFAVYLNVRAFAPDEFEEAVCSIPDKYLLRFIGCTYDNSPATFKTFAELLYQCVDEFYENTGIADSVLLFMCHDYVQIDEDVQSCLNDKEKKLEEPELAEIIEFEKTVKHCLINAK